MTWFYLLVAYGLCFGIQNKAAFLRRIPILKLMLPCTYCVGTHSGWMAWGLAFCVDGRVPPIVHGGAYPTTWFGMGASFVAWALAGAAFCYALDTLVRWAETRTA